MKSNNSIVLRLCSQEMKNLIIENRKFLSCSFPSRPASAEPAFPIQPPRAWKMYVSPYLDPIDVKNQRIVLKSFLSQQHNDNECPSFKAFAKGF